ncbi:uncharacterized protein PITG_08680 [Phytophthora infestans T30-4]|uniref:Uncharacterized protein n=1 Tax=Phytophthora infestans (strain T30-4) TaxID=403677 RepID=D0NCX7_PHYIT|nr:uncharacterized protein PITG_08680 [Phytophthora infestans T30-4]EEY55934.1 conserved hypothetical protein [Phytophthora infestans T30-4]|eukprot:XP_002902764.1 conserved hypothetical protein [Phytophthora infestans T30-4]
MSEALKALESASRRELQALAKELQLCRGNAKSDVIVSNAAEFLDKHPKDGEQMVLAALGSSRNVTPVASPVAKKITPKKDTSKKQEKAVADVDVNIKETQINKQQPRNEPRKVGMKNHEKKTPTKKVTLAVTTKATPTIASQAKSSRVKASSSTKKSPTRESHPAPTIASQAKSSRVKASSSTKKSPTRESHPASAENNVIAAKEGGPVIDKKPALASRKAELKARKTVEALVKSAKDLTFVGDSRVRCSTTGHEMKADVDVITTYIYGKRYLKARNLKLSFAKVGNCPRREECQEAHFCSKVPKATADLESGGGCKKGGRRGGGSTSGSSH